MLDDLRQAWEANDYLGLLAQTLREVPCRNDYERAELAYYRAFVCCVFKGRSERFAHFRHSYSQRAVTLMRAVRHPLLYRALWSMYNVESDHDDAAALPLVSEVLTLTPDGPWQIHARVASVMSHVLSGRAAAAVDPASGLTTWLKEQIRSGEAFSHDLFKAARANTCFSTAVGATAAAREHLLTMEACFDQLVLAEVAQYMHVCDLSLAGIVYHRWLNVELARNGALLSLRHRLQQLRQRVAALPHLCAGAEADLWQQLAEAAMALESETARAFAKAAWQALMRVPSWQTDSGIFVAHSSLLSRLQSLQPKPLTGEWAELLTPEAWPFWNGGNPGQSEAKPNIVLLN